MISREKSHLAANIDSCVNELTDFCISLRSYTRTSDPTIEFPMDPRVSRVMDYLRRHLARRIGLAEAAKIACIERTHFSRLFNANAGSTFSEWVVKIRIQEAKRLLEGSRCSVTVVAASVGYTDVTTFERAFRRVEGICPREFRRSRLSGATETIDTKNAERFATNAETRE
jgi:transcriptional regulator GlxA family with amidase domain